MYNYVMIRYGDLTLKGKNQKQFKNTVNHQIRNKLSDLDVSIEFQHDMVYVRLDNVEPEEVIARLDFIAGLSSYSKVIKCEYDLKTIADNAIQLIKHEYAEKPLKFKIETKRADKRIPITSLEISQQVSRMVLPAVQNLTVDVHEPDFTLNIEARRDATYIYTERIPGMGGFPVSIGGKALVLLSGGIDSPVSAYLAMKTGLEVECIHFESTPMTSIESAQKVVDLTEKLARYSPEAKIKLHMVPFKDLHEQIILKIPESYIITIMRRMMYRIATEIAKRNNCLALISGDSVGQVASQTLESMITIQSVTDALVIRPLSTFDKLEIMKIAKKIDTLEISNRPFQDCCTIYVPKSPVIRPTNEKAEEYESAFNYEDLLNETVNDTISIVLSAKKHLDIQSKGLTVSEGLMNESVGN